MFFPAPIGKLNLNQSIDFEGNCFESISMDLELNGDIARLILYAKKPKSGYCQEVILVGNSNIWHVEDIFFQGKHVFDFKISTKNSFQEIKFKGL